MTWDALKFAQNYKNTIGYRKQKSTVETLIENTKGIMEDKKLLERP